MMKNSRQILKVYQTVAIFRLTKMPQPIPKSLHKQVVAMLRVIHDKEQEVALRMLDEWKREIVRAYLAQMGSPSIEQEVCDLLTFSFEFDARFNKHYLRIQVGKKQKKAVNSIVGDGCLWYAIEEAVCDVLQATNKEDSALDNVITAFNRQTAGVKVIGVQRASNNTALVTVQVTVPFSEDPCTMMEALHQKFSTIKEEDLHAVRRRFYLLYRVHGLAREDSSFSIRHSVGECRGVPQA